MGCKIAIRMDDITPDMDWERFLEFKKLLDEYGIKPLIGIVPDNRDENLHRAKEAGDFWEYIKELQDNGWGVLPCMVISMFTPQVKAAYFLLTDFQSLQEFLWKNSGKC